MPETGYGSEEFVRACRLAAACREIDDTGPRAAWGRRRAAAGLARYQRRLPVTNLHLTASPTGRMIAEHFAIRDDDGYSYRHAQGVLDLPADFADYLRGRHRQAVRTNIGHARRAGLTLFATAIDGWAPGLGDSRRPAITPGPIERWLVLDTDGAPVAEAILSVDDEVALLHGSVAFTPNARWLIHTAFVERLCGSCSVLVTNGPPAYSLGTGHQYFQRLLGYRLARLRVTVAPASNEQRPQPAGLPWPPTALTCGIARSRMPALAGSRN